MHQTQQVYGLHLLDKISHHPPHIPHLKIPNPYQTTLQPHSKLLNILKILTHFHLRLQIPNHHKVTFRFHLHLQAHEIIVPRLTPSHSHLLQFIPLNLLLYAFFILITLIIGPRDCVA